MKAQKVIQKATEAGEPIPEKVTIDQSGGGLRISYRWHRSSSAGLMAFFMLWTIPFIAIFILLLVDSITTGEFNPFILFPLPFMAGGLFVIYISLAGLVDRTIIEVEGGSVKIAHRPLPYFGQRVLGFGDIKQLYVSQGMSERTYRKTTQLYTLMLCLSSGKELKVVRNIDSVEAASFMERHLEDALHIRDMRMPKESPEIANERAMEVLDSITDYIPPTKEAELTRSGTLMPSWYLVSGQDDQVGSLISKGIGFNRNIAVTTAILLFMFSVIILMASSSGAPIFSLVMIPLAFFGILFFAIRSTGTRTYHSNSGDFQYAMWVKKGTLNTPQFVCLNVNDGSHPFVEEGGTIKFDDGTTYMHISGTSGPQRSGRSAVLQPDYRNVSISIFRKDEDRYVPLVVVKDTSDSKAARAKFYLEPNEKHIDQLTGFAVFLFHNFKINPNFVIGNKVQVQIGTN